MDRRTFICGVAAGLVTAPLAVAAQPAGRSHRLGGLVLGLQPSPEQRAKSPFRQGLRGLGWIEGQNLTMDWRYTMSPEELASLADELIRLNPEVIVVQSAGVATVVRKATTTIPIVVLTAGELEGSGLVESLARPGGNVTGIQLFSRELIGKRLELLRETLPTRVRVGVLSENATTAELARVVARYRDETETAGRALGLDLIYFTAQRADEFEGGFDGLVARRAQALLVYSTPFMLAHRQRLAELALQHRLPSTFEVREYVVAGGLMSYGVNLAEILRRGAGFVDKILKGTKPADLPVEQPTKFELVINLKTAKALGLTIPRSLLLRADEVIQ